MPKGDAGIKTIQCSRTDDHPAHPAGPAEYCVGLKLTKAPREIFRTIHGSHLYGLAHEGSDLDTFIVTDSAYLHAHQTVVNGTDVVRVGFNTFFSRALGGSHQSVEALFSPYKMWNPDFSHLIPFIESAVVCGGPVYEKYERTIHKFSFGDFKRRRHAVRLSQNLAGLRELGRFNPVMTEGEIAAANTLAQGLEGEPLWKTLMG